MRPKIASYGAVPVDTHTGSCSRTFIYFKEDAEQKQMEKKLRIYERTDSTKGHKT
jgi:hypothetical protein